MDKLTRRACPPKLQRRREMLSENIGRALNMYLAQNGDRYERASVFKVILSEDANSATVVINSAGDRRENIEKINADRKEIAQFLTNYFEVKTMPKLKFFFDEIKDF